MNGDDELLNLSLTEAAGKVRTREVSPVDLVQAALRRIRATDDVLRSYITVFEE